MYKNNELINLDKKMNNKLTIIDLKGVKLYFSYSTIVAFRQQGEVTISKNIWSKTTGKHLNYINSNKDIRINNKKFKKNITNKLYKAISK